MNYVMEAFDENSPTGLGVSVCQCGRQISGPGHSFGPTVRDYYVIHYITGGCGVYRVEGRSYYLSAGEGFLILPGQSTYYCADSKSPWEYCWFGFRGPEVPALLRRAGLGADTPVFSYQKDGRLRRYLSGMLDAAGDSPSCDTAMTGYLYLCFSCLIRSERRETRTDAYLIPAVRCIEQNYAHPLTVEQIAREAGVDRSYLHRLFVARFGVPVGKYLRDYRIAKARRLLEDASVSVEEAARSTGFSDTAHFTRAFRRVCGQTPSSYRKNPL